MSHPIPDAALSQHIIVLGKTRSGKSSTMRLLIEGLLEAGKPVCIIDPKGDWWGLKSSASGKEAGFPVIIFGGEHADVPINAHAGAYVAELVATGNRPCIIDLGGWTVADRTRFFVDFASTLFRHTRGPRWLAIDEVHNFAPQGKVQDPEAGKMLHWANRLASEGAGKGITLISASQRPQKVHKDYVTSHETLIAMRVIHPLDRSAIKEWIDGCPDPATGKEVLATLASMQRGEGWVWSPEIGFGPVRIQFPLFRTYDSFKAPSGESVSRLKGWATVDLDDVKAKLAAVVEEAKANDPKALKAEIAQLRRQMTEASSAAAKAGSTPDPSAIAVAEERGHERGLAEGKRTAVSAFAALARDLADAIGRTEEACGDARRLLNSFATFAETQAAAVPSPPRQQQRAIPAPPRPTAVDDGPSRAHQKILDAVAWWNLFGVPRPSQAQVAFVAGYSHKSGTWATYLSRLRSAGLIDGRGEIVLTFDGRAVAAVSSLPRDGESFRSAVLDKIDGSLARILRPILQAYPDEISQASAGEAAGYSHSSGTWATYLSRLRSLDLIAGRGSLRASDWLFPEGRK